MNTHVTLDFLLSDNSNIDNSSNWLGDALTTDDFFLLLNC